LSDDLQRPAHGAPHLIRRKAHGDRLVLDGGLAASEHQQSEKEKYASHGPWTPRTTPRLLPTLSGKSPERTLGRQLEREMVGRDMHALPQIEAVGIETLHSGIELEIHAAMGASLRDEPAQQGLAVTLRTLR